MAGRSPVRYIPPFTPGPDTEAERMWEQWITRYGYLALFLGTMVEGEAVLIVAGYAIARGYLDPLPTYLVAVAGGMTADTAYFWLGRSFGAKLVRSHPRFRPLRARATLFLRRRGHSAAFLTRFAYGLRIVLPIMIGALRMRPGVYHLFDALGALTFAATYLLAGALFGPVLAALAARVGAREGLLLAGTLALGLVALAVRQWRIYRAARQE